MAGNKIYVQGSYIDVHDNENVYLNVDKAEVSLNEKTAPQKDADDVVVNQLIPIFYGVESEARNFVACIQGMKPTQITAIVNKLVSERKISEMSRKRDLWKVLHDAGLYTRSDTNWYQQVK